MNKKLFNILERFPSRKIVVVGDLIADEFLYGRIARISREAPVLVLEYQDLIRLPGGAANAANNLLDLGCKVTIAGNIGQDEPGKDLISILQKKGANVSPLRKSSSYLTPVKTRILAGAHHSAPQQIVRVDRLHNPGLEHTLSWEKLRNHLHVADGIILSDYGYSTFSPNFMDKLIGVALKRSIPIVVDSRFRMSAFKGVTSMTPNITELEAAVGISIGSDERLLHEVGRTVMHTQDLKYLLVTQGRFGMTLFERDKEPRHIPIYGTDDVADVTGAGDTVIAVFTLALACGASAEQAARLANYAGGIVVMKRGTATVTRQELLTAITKDS
jgi:D-glycero-beta-D-manno-heptose-7-phosphate kinase